MADQKKKTTSGKLQKEERIVLVQLTGKTPQKQYWGLGGARNNSMQEDQTQLGVTGSKKNKTVAEGEKSISQGKKYDSGGILLAGEKTINGIARGMGAITRRNSVDGSGEEEMVTNRKTLQLGNF